MTTALQAPPNYFRDALYSQYNLILFGGSALFSLASASTLPVLVGLGAEVCWLGIGPRLGAFRRRVDAERQQVLQSKLDDEISEGLRTLEPEYAARVQGVSRTILELRSSGAVDPTGAPLFEALEPLRSAFLRLCKFQQRLRNLLTESENLAPEVEVARLSAAYAVERELGARLTLRQALQISQKQVEHQERLRSSLRNVELKSSLIEQSLTHLRSQQQAMMPTHELANEVRNVLGHLVAVEGIEAELEGVPSARAGQSAAAISVAPGSL